jgi:hypothetical protein
MTNVDGKYTGENGQSCFWFSNGCAIGCDYCDGFSRGPIPGDHKNKSGGGIPGGWDRKFPVCPNNTAKATICDKALRTINTDAACGAADDWYYFSPWRYPGFAGVTDSCGVAGGHVPPQGGFGGRYYNTTNAKLGDKGSKVLPKYDTGSSWKAGSTVEVSLAWHTGLPFFV